jgi:hypothetical protein
MNIDTDEGMENAKIWLESLIGMLSQNGVWAIPRSSAIYSFDKKNKIATRINSDAPTDRVLKELGWQLK